MGTQTLKSQTSSWTRCWEERSTAKRNRATGLSKSLLAFCVNFAHGTHFHWCTGCWLILVKFIFLFRGLYPRKIIEYKCSKWTLVSISAVFQQSVKSINFINIIMCQYLFYFFPSLHDAISWRNHKRAAYARGHKTNMVSRTIREKK